MTEESDYPTYEQLQRVTEWSEFFPHTNEHADYSAWFAFIKSIWWMPDWGWKEYDGKDDGEPIRVFHISTGGWSGNEDIIHAMSKNFIGWSQTFRIHRRGGHYEFGFDRRGEKPKSPDAVVPVGGTGTEGPRA